MKGARAALGAVLVSLFGHWLAIKLVDAPATPAQVPNDPSLRFAWVETAPVPAAITPVASAEPSAHDPAPLWVRRTNRHARTSVPPPAAVPTTPEADPSIGPMFAPPVAADAIRAVVQAPPPRPALDLSPRAIALGTLPLSAAPATLATHDTGSDVAASLSADLYAAANARSARARAAPELTRDRDGTCHYAGQAIDATIHPDGGVDFHDLPAGVERRLGLDARPEHPTTLEDQRAPTRGQATLRVSTRAWAAEREWFLRETKPIRTQLADVARERDLAKDAVVFRRQLDQIWCDTKLSVELRHHRIFQLWDDTSADEIGARARAVVVEYVRYHLAANSSHAFTRPELDGLNAGRSQRDQFDPYAAAPRDPDVATP
jgi:hypothetical protein